MTLSAGILALTVLVFAFRGLRKGFFGALGGILSLIAGYVAAFLACKPLAAQLKGHMGLDGLMVYVVAGIIAFAVASLLTSFCFNLLEKVMSSHEALSGISRIGGLCVGALVGGILGFLLIYLLGIYQEFKQTEAVDNTSALQQTTRQLISGAATTALNHTYPEAASLGTAFIEDPVQMGQSLNKVLNNDELKMLLQDPDHQQMLERGDIQSLANSPDFQAVAGDVDMQYLLQHHSDVMAGEDPALSLARHMSDVWQAVQNRKGDHRVQAIINDPAFQHKLHNNDRWALMRDPQLLELMQLLYDTKSGEAGVKANP